ncbi:porin [Paraburkholderia caribensis]|uniref:porin n=1 Tax=Paraburkholderia caribensis TaxID=75105 RepID=UPI00078E4C1B|nr:porin [Paraburkholderia caribensis]AMV47830.1 porin [Paraburkholderia caribensis]
MKLSRKLLLAAYLLSIAYNSSAQSSVTIYGIIDDSIQYVHNTDGKSNQIGLQSGQFSVSHWGLKGNEDLGGGLSTNFTLESGFDINSGALTGSLFGRQAFVGLKSDRYGTVTVGRQYDAVEDLTYEVQPNSYGYYFTTPGDVDNADASVRINNAIKWASPAIAGFQAEAMYAFGGVAGSTGSGQSYSAAFLYTHGPLKMAAGYLHIDNGNAVTSTRGVTTAGSLFFSPVNEAYASASKINIGRAGLSYAIGPVTLGGYYSYSEYLSDASSKFSGAERYNNGSIYAVWQVNPATYLQTGYDYLKSHGDSSATYQQVTLAADYLLSKRTDVYASASYRHASGKNGLGSAQAVIADSYAAAGTSTQELVMLGFRHRF